MQLAAANRGGGGRAEQKVAEKRRKWKVMTVNGDIMGSGGPKKVAPRRKEKIVKNC
jgi:hypothetical protein